MQFLQRAMGGQQVWVRRLEHGVLRVVSLGFSMASAHAIRWFFAPLDGVDALQPAITWMIALGFGLLGYFVSRGLAHRLMNRERIRAYAPICVVVEVVEIFCNYALAAAVIQRAAWLQAVPIVQRTFLTDATYVVLSIIPLVSVLLAVVDMDMERSKGGGMGGSGLHVGLGGGFGGLGGRRQARLQRQRFSGRAIRSRAGACHAWCESGCWPFRGGASDDGARLVLDPVTGVLVVTTGNGQRLSRQEATLIRAAQAQGIPVQFADRHQWRHFQVRYPA